MWMVGVQRDGVQTMCRARAGGWHADVLHAEAYEQKEKTAKKKTYLGVDDGCVHACMRCRADSAVECILMLDYLLYYYLPLLPTYLLP